MPKKFITIEDIRNPKRKSGFNHVGDASGEADRNTGRRRWRAVYKGLASGVSDIRGKSHGTPEEAAQDYCDYINGRTVPVPATLKSAGHSYENIYAHSKDSEEEAALGVLRDKQAQRAGRQGYVYLIREVNPGGGLHYVKVGYSVNPKKRVAELQTGNPRPLALHALKKGTPDDESALHQKYIKDNTLQEWFVVSTALLLEFDLDPDGKPWAKAKREAKA